MLLGVQFLGQQSDTPVGLWRPKDRRKGESRLSSKPDLPMVDRLKYSVNLLSIPMTAPDSKVIGYVEMRWSAAEAGGEPSFEVEGLDIIGVYS